MHPRIKSATAVKGTWKNEHEPETRGRQSADTPHTHQHVSQTGSEDVLESALCPSPKAAENESKERKIRINSLG